MDLLVVVLMGAGVLALLALGAADAVGSRSRRAAARAAAPAAARRQLVLVADGTTPLADLDAALAALQRDGDRSELVGDGAALRRVAARLTGIPLEALAEPADGTRSVLQVGGPSAVVVSWNVSDRPAGPSPAAG